MDPENTCHEIEPELTALAQGELAADRAAEVERHLAACSACREALEGIRSVFGAAEAIEQIAPSLRFKRRMQALAAEVAAEAEQSLAFRLRTAVAFLGHRLRASPRFRLAAASVAVHAVLLLLLSLFVLPEISRKGPSEVFVKKLVPDSSGAGETVRPDPIDGPSLPGVGVEGPLPSIRENPNPFGSSRVPSEDLDILAELKPSTDRLLRVTPSALFGSRIDEELKVRRLAAMAGRGRGSYDALQRSLAWLAGRQEDDGSWPSSDRSPKYRTGVTAAALLAFLSDGHSHARGRKQWRPVVARAVDRLLSVQHDEGVLKGLIGAADGHYTYNHALATLALVEVWTLDSRRLPRTRMHRLRSAIQDAVAFILRAQTPTGAWRYRLYTGKDFESDTSVSLFMVMALAAARDARFDVPDESFSRFAVWLRQITGETGVVGYQRPGDRDSLPRTLTAGALFIEELLGLVAPLRDLQAAQVRQEIEAHHGSVGRNGLLRFYATLAFRLRGAPVLHHFAPELLASQRRDGSWSAADDLHAVHGGDVFLTSLNVLTLTSAYRWAGN
jgi:hypothetical protein